MTVKPDIQKVVWILILVMLTLAGGSAWLVNFHLQKDIVESKITNERELKLLASLVKNELRMGNYQQAAENLQDWGESTPDVISIKLVAINDFEISNFEREHKSTRTQSYTLALSYSFSGRANLSLTKDLSFIDAHKLELIGQLTLANLLVAFLLVALVRLIQHSRNDAYQQRLHILEVEKEKARTQLYLDTVEAIIVALDTNGRINLINRKGAETLGYTQKELIGQNWFITCLPQPTGYDEVYPYFLKLVSGDIDGIEYNENEIVTCTGSFRQIAWHNSLIYNESGQVIGALSAGEDITERLLAENERARLQEELFNTKLKETTTLEKKVAERTKKLLEAQETADQANAAKSDFLAKMSHELRTPLNAIIGISEQKHEDAIEFGDGEYIEPLFRVHRAGEHLLDLINDILDLSKIEAGKMDLKYVPVEVLPLVEEALDSTSVLASKNSNQIQLKVEEKIGKIQTDPLRLQQILLNVLSNACKFTKNGLIVVSISRQTDSRGDWIVFAVEDNGIGMSQKQLDQLFQDFTQLDSKASRSAEGTGLGLSISKKIVDLMGGHIEVESTPDKGSKFSIKLPLSA